jgi:hypothetical protein
VYERDLTIDALIAAGRISEVEAANRDRVEHAMSVILSEWVEVNKDD